MKRKETQTHQQTEGRKKKRHTEWRMKRRRRVR